ncbi:MAG: sugar ABC transporter ATP-binding protein [Clostridiaceae bacterium]
MSYIEFQSINKYFPGVKALSDIQIRAESGRVYALLGENGAGKSTLLKIMNGDYKPDSGSIVIDGKVVRFDSPREAIDHGISVIYQERQVLKEMTVAENVFLGSWIIGKGGMVDFERMNSETGKICAQFGLPLTPDEKVGKLSAAMQQMVEIMKAVRRDSSIIAFDEPTASLSDNEIDILFQIIRQLKAQNKVILYVSHRMKEIAQITDEVIVFKDGKIVGQVETPKATNDELIRMMVGRPLGKVFEELERNGEIGETVLELKHVTTDYVTDVSFAVRKGEILGFAGLVGAGRTEIMRALFGLDPILSGEVWLEGKRLQIGSPQDAIAQGIAMVPEDRKDQGILPNISVKGNISIAILRTLLNKLFMIDDARETQIAERAIEKYKIRTPGADKQISQLSGGNQQKAVLARWLEMRPKILILDEPTKGIDVGAKAEFYSIICECARAGITVLLVSSELPEIIGLCDRVVVVREGGVSAIVDRKNSDEEVLLRYAMIDEKNA